MLNFLFCPSEFASWLPMSAPSSLLPSVRHGFPAGVEQPIRLGKSCDVDLPPQWNALAGSFKR
jgi:hypothetical protein